MPLVMPESKRYVPSLEQARAAGEEQIYQDPGATMEQRLTQYKELTPRVNKFMDFMNFAVGGGEALAARAEQKAISLAAARVAEEGTSLIAESELSRGMKDLLKQRRLSQKAQTYADLPPEYREAYSTALGKGPVATSRYKKIFDAAKGGDEEAMDKLTQLVAIRRQYAEDAMTEAQTLADFYDEIPPGLEGRLQKFGTRPIEGANATFDMANWEMQVAPRASEDIQEIVGAVAHELAGHGSSAYFRQAAEPGTALGRLHETWTNLHQSARALRRESEGMLAGAQEEGGFVGGLATKRIKDIRRALYEQSPEEVFANSVDFHMRNGADYRSAVKQAAKDVNDLLYNSYHEMVKAKDALGLSTEIKY